MPRVLYYVLVFVLAGELISLELNGQDHQELPSPSWFLNNLYLQFFNNSKNNVNETIKGEFLIFQRNLTLHHVLFQILLRLK